MPSLWTSPMSRPQRSKPNVEDNNESKRGSSKIWMAKMTEQKGKDVTGHICTLGRVVDEMAKVNREARRRRVFECQKGEK